MKSSGGTRGYPDPLYMKIMSVITDIEQNGYSTQPPFRVGMVDAEIRSYSNANGIELGSNSMYMSPAQIGHTMRALHAAKGIDISARELASFPRRKGGMEIYHDSNGDKFVYYDGKNKYVVQPNYRLKLPTGRTKVVNFITAYRTNGTEFNQRNFTKIR